jgi:hypothetical protein
MRRRAETIQRSGTVHHLVANTCIDFRVNIQGAADDLLLISLLVYSASSTPFFSILADAVL